MWLWEQTDYYPSVQMMKQPKLYKLALNSLPQLANKLLQQFWFLDGLSTALLHQPFYVTWTFHKQHFALTKKQTCGKIKTLNF